MYKVNDIVIYGKMGACKVTDITVPKHLNISGHRLYYVLKPFNENCTIYTPVNTPVFMRPVISAEEADRLIDKIPSFPHEAIDEESTQDLVRHYESALESHDCEDLIKLTMAIHAKKQEAEGKGRKLGQIDQRFMKQAEAILFGEFALAFGIPQEQVPSYIASRVAGRDRKLA